MMMPTGTHKQAATVVDATVTAKGQVTLPKALRNRLGIQTGSKIRFTMQDSGAVKVEPVLHELEDLWRMADQISDRGDKAGDAMTFDEMNAAKAERKW